MAGTGLPGLRMNRAFTQILPSVDVTQGLDASMDAVGKVAGILKDALQPAANAEAAEAGAKAVTRGEDGKLKVDSRMPLTEEDRYYMNAAESAYLSELQVDVMQQFRDLRAKPELQLDEVAFKEAADGMIAGIMESAPAEFRGSVQQLWNREVIRNTADIGDMRDRITLRKQEGSVRAAMEMAQNDVYALAMQGGLNTAAGQEAVGRYKNALGMLRNPLFGVSEEEIELMASETMSFAKGYSAKGAIRDVYQRQGYDAAVKAADEFFSSTDLDLSPAQRESLKNDALQEVRGMEQDRQRQASEYRQAQSTAMAANAAELDVAINDYALGLGGSYDDLKATTDAMLAGGHITPASWASKTKRLSNVAAVQRKKTEEEELVLREAVNRMESGRGYDATNPKDLVLADVGFSRMVPSDADQQTVVDVGVQHAANYGIVPTAVREAIKPGLYSGSAQNRVQAANNLVRLLKANPMATDKAFNTTEIEDAQKIMDEVAGGADPEAALETLKEFKAMPADEKQALRGIVTPMFAKGNEKREGIGQGRTDALTLLGSMGVSTDFNPNAQTDSTVPVAKALEDYETWYTNAFIRTGSHNAAKTSAETKMRSAYGPTRFGMRQPVPAAPEMGGILGEIRRAEVEKKIAAPPIPPPRLQHRSPELLYGSGQPEVDFEWQSEQLADDLKALGIKPEEIGLESLEDAGALTLVESPSPGPQDEQVYQVFGPNGQPVISPITGESLWWRPDPERWSKENDGILAGRNSEARKEQLRGKPVDAELQGLYEGFAP